MVVFLQGHDEFKGKTFQLTGPNEYSYKELVEFVADVTMKKDVELVNVPVGAARLAGKFMGELINPWLTKDLVEEMLVDVVAKKDPSLLTLEDLDITPQSLDRLAFDYLSRFRTGGHFKLVQGYH